MQYRIDVRSKGVRAADVNLDKLIASGMTPEPKTRFSNSVLDDVKAKEDAADKAENAKVKADVNGGVPELDPEAKAKREKKLLEMQERDAPNPNAGNEDPKEDPAAVAAAANAGENNKKAALVQMHGDEPDPTIEGTKVASVRGPPGAPIGYGVHKLAAEAVNPYAAKLEYRAAQPANGI